MIQFQFKYETVKFTEKKYSLVINKSVLKGLFPDTKEDKNDVEMEDDWAEGGDNKNLEVRVEEIVKEKIEERKIPVNQ